MSDYEEFLEGMKGLAGELQAVNQRATDAYAPIVDEIVRSRSRDINHIEHTLDGLLGFCCHDAALVLFKKLCRYYWDIDPIATAGHINAYRDMWDSDEIEAVAPDGDDA